MVPVTIVVDKRAYPDYGRIESMLVQVDDVDLQMKMQAFNQRPLAEAQTGMGGDCERQARDGAMAGIQSEPGRQQIASQYALAHAVLPGPADLDRQRDLSDGAILSVAPLRGAPPLRDPAKPGRG